MNEQAHPATLPTGSGKSRAAALVALCLAVLVAQLDTSIVNLAVQPIGKGLDAGVTAMQWIVDGYNLTYAALLLTGGLLADLFGRRRILIAGALVFIAASLCCAVAPSVPVLIAGRLLTGLGSALLLPASLAMLRVLWPDPAERGRVLGIWTSCNGLALALGPSIGGVLIAVFGWRSIFLIVIPVGLVMIALALRVLPESRQSAGRSFDWLGQLLGIVTLAGFALSATEAGDRHAIALLALLCGAIAFGIFLKVEAGRGQGAMVPLALFRLRAFDGAVAATACMTFGMYGVLFILPLTWQAAAGLSAVHAGLLLMPMALAFVLTSPFSGKLAERLGARVMTSAGVATIAGGLYVIAATAGGGFAVAELGLAVTGLGMGLATGPLTGLAVGAVEADRAGTAASLINVARMVGATIGVAILGTVFVAAGEGAAGLRDAMLLGGSVQLAGAAAVFMTARPSAGERPG